MPIITLEPKETEKKIIQVQREIYPAAGNIRLGDELYVACPKHHGVVTLRSSALLEHASLEFLERLPQVVLFGSIARN